jgi:hypothetical protein
VEFELFFGLWLLSGILPKPTWAVAMVLFGLFTCVSFYKALSGHATCGCFGRVPVNPWYTTTLDVSIVLSLLRWRPRGLSRFSFDENGTVPFLGRAMSVLAAWLLVGLPAAFAMGSYTDTTLSDAGETFGRGNIIVFEPEEWTGKRFPLLDYVDVGDRLKQGRWQVLLFHHDCPKCRAAIREYQTSARCSAIKPDSPRVAVIEVPPYDEYRKQSLFEGTSCVLVRLSDTKKWFVETPVWLNIHDGNVIVTNCSGGAVCPKTR